MVLYHSYGLKMEKYFTKQRLSSYNKIDDYVQNIKICQKMYPLLNVFEIVLRNRINNFFITRFGTAWLKQMLKPSFSFSPGKEIAHKLSTAEHLLTKDKKAITQDSLLSNLTLGFWVALLSAENNQFFKNLILYDKKMKSKHNEDFMKVVFLLNSVDAGSIAKVKEVQDELDKIRVFRNRVFHYEKITHLSSDIEILLKSYFSKFQTVGTTELEDFLIQFDIAGYAVKSITPPPINLPPP